MKILLTICLFAAAACSSGGGTSANAVPAASPSSQAVDPAVDAVGVEMATPTPAAISGGPKTIREFFMALPEKYFYMEGCERPKDKDCQAAKREYLKTYTEVEDIKNGYLKAGCDGAQSCIEMAIFRKPDNSYLVMVATEAEDAMDQYFLTVTDGSWKDASAAVPEYSKNVIYAVPRQGTTVSVFAKKVIEKGDDYEMAERGAKLYDLVWKDGKFSKK